MFEGGYLLSRYSGPGKIGEKISIESGQGWEEKFGRYLIIQMDNGNDVLNLAEVTAFGGVKGDKTCYSLLLGIIKFFCSTIFTCILQLDQVHY